MLLRLFLGVVFIVLVGCAHQTLKTDHPISNTADTSDTELEKIQQLDDKNAGELDQQSKIVGIKEIPHETNEQVKRWIDFFQNGRGRPLMEKYLARSERYLKIMKQILKEEGVPEDLVYVALIESGFSSSARSTAAAVGYWQFINGTARNYGLTINSWVDDRRDPVLATRAAARYLGGLYKVFNSWYLAMASYNVGENRVKRAVMQNYTRNFWQLAQKRALPQETLDYIPKFLAARLIAQNPEKFGFSEIDYEDPFEFSVIKIDRPVNLKDLSKNLNISYYDMKRLNPKFRREFAPVASGEVEEIRVPADKQELAQTTVNQCYTSLPRYFASSTHNHRIRRGETLTSIARKYGMSVRQLRDINDISRGTRIKIGSYLTVTPKVKRFTKVRRIATSTRTSKHRRSIIHVVKRGDTLIDIAEKYQVSLKDIAKKNGLNRRSKLLVGNQLVIPNKAVD